MCTEKLAKAYTPVAPARNTHAAFRSFIANLPLNSNAVAPLGFADLAALTRWQTSVSTLVGAVEDLAPSLAGKLLPNAEYPWPTDSPTTAPADYPFDVEFYRHFDAQAACGEPPFLDVLGRMVATMRSDAWHL